MKLLFGLDAGFWLVSGFLALAGVIDFGLSGGVRILGVLMLGNGIALALAGIFSLRGHRFIDLFALGLLALNALLSITDEIGVLDLAALLVNGILFAWLCAALFARRAAAKRPEAEQLAAEQPRARLPSAPEEILPGYCQRAARAWRKSKAYQYFQPHKGD